MYDLDAVVRRHRLVVGRSNARVVQILCVYHHEKTPSLTIWRETQTWYCHGCCKRGTVQELVEFLSGPWQQPEPEQYEDVPPEQLRFWPEGEIVPF